MGKQKPSLNPWTNFVAGLKRRKPMAVPKTNNVQELTRRSGQRIAQNVTNLERNVAGSLGARMYPSGRPAAAAEVSGARPARMVRPDVPFPETTPNMPVNADGTPKDAGSARLADTLNRIRAKLAAESMPDVNGQGMGLRRVMKEQEMARAQQDLDTVSGIRQRLASLPDATEGADTLRTQAELARAASMGLPAARQYERSLPNARLAGRGNMDYEVPDETFRGSIRNVSQLPDGSFGSGLLTGGNAASVLSPPPANAGRETVIVNRGTMRPDDYNGPQGQSYEDTLAQARARMMDRRMQRDAGLATQEERRAGVLANAQRQAEARQRRLNPTPEDIQNRQILGLQQAAAMGNRAAAQVLGDYRQGLLAQRQMEMEAPLRAAQADQARAEAEQIRAITGNANPERDAIVVAMQNMDPTSPQYGALAQRLITMLPGAEGPTAVSPTPGALPEEQARVMSPDMTDEQLLGIIQQSPEAWREWADTEESQGGSAVSSGLDYIRETTGFGTGANAIARNARRGLEQYRQQQLKHRVRQLLTGLP